MTLSTIMSGPEAYLSARAWAGEKHGKLFRLPRDSAKNHDSLGLGRGLADMHYPLVEIKSALTR